MGREREREEIDERPRAAGWAERRVRPEDVATTEAPRNRGAWSRIPWGWIGAAAIPVALTGLGMAAFRNSEVGRWADRLPLIEEQVRAAGMPLRPEEVEWRLPPEKNGAAALRALLAEQAELKKSGASLFDPIGTAIAEERIRDLAIEAARFEKFAYGRRWQDGAGVLFPEFGNLRDVARILAEDAVRAAESGDSARLDESLRTIDRLGALIGSERTLIAALVGISISAIAERAAQDAMRAAPTPATLEGIARYGKRRAPITDIAESFAGEIFFLSHYTRSVATFRKDTQEMEVPMDEEPEYSPENNTPRLPLFGAATTLDAWRAYGLNRYLDAVRRLRSSDVPAGRVKAMNGWDSAPGDKGSAGRLFAFISPIFARATSSQVGQQASREMTDAMREALARGGKPARLPDDPGKPGRPIGYLPLPGGGFRLHSVGGDGTGDIRNPSGDDKIASYPTFEPMRTFAGGPP